MHTVSIVVLVAGHVYGKNAIKLKVTSYIAQYPVLSTVQNTLGFARCETCSIVNQLDFSEKDSATL